MISNLSLNLVANTTYKDYAYNYLTNTTSDFSTGAACSTNGSCVINSNTRNGFYSWYAAIAGTQTSTMAAGDDFPTSICPKGWRLPSNYAIDTVKSYGNLTMAYLGFPNNAFRNDVATLERVPLSFSRAGWYINGVPYGTGDGGCYWSSTASGSGTANYFDYNNSLTFPQHSSNMYYGARVRCLAQ